jgi:PAS domain S-box-containing protein/diguanylate cyclase (GGDEF)-like protein
LDFSVCSHDTAKGLKFWESFVKNLEKKVGENINFEPINSFVEEEEKLNSKIYHLYYARPEKVIWFYQKGYKPVAKFKNKKDAFFIIGKNENIINYPSVRVATALSNPPAYGLLGINFEEIEVVFTEKWEEVFYLVKDGKVDIGVIYNESWENIENKEDVKVIKEIEFETYHIFMAHPSVYDRIKPILLTFEFLEEATEEDILKSIELFKIFELYSKKWEEHDIANTVLNIENVGVIIYQEKIVYANNYVVEISGYNKDEILGKSILDFVYEGDKEKVSNLVERRLKGEKFKTSNNEIRVISKSGKLLILNVFSSTVLYKGKYSGFLLFFDISKQKRYERLYHLLREVNQAITFAILEEELFEKISKALVEKIGLKFVWVGVKEDDNPFFKVVYKYGEDRGYLEQVKISWREDLPTGKGPTGIAFRSDKITIIPNTQTDPRFDPWKDYAKERGFLSVASIPVKVDGKVKYVFTLYAPEPEFFDEDTLSVLEELKSDLEFAFEKLENLRKSILISKALEHSSSWIMIVDENFNITYVNDTVCEISGYSKEELIGKNPRIFKSGILSKDFYEGLYSSLLSGNPYTGTFINKKKSGELFYLKTTIYPVEIPPNIKRYIAIGTDITQEVELQKEITKLQNYDKLTDLLNISGFFLIVSEELKETDRPSFLALIDIKDFISINKTYGLNVGDFLLKEVADRMRLVFPDSILARVSADEFAIYKPLTNKKEIEVELIEFTDKIKSVFKYPIYFGDKQITLTFNAGISIAPLDGENLELLYENASTALAYSKAEGENVIELFSKKMEEKLKNIVFAKDIIEKAIKENLFVLFYQPFFNCKTLELEGFEALVRIKDKDGKIYTPNIFIDVLENSKYLFDYEKWLLNKIKETAQKWHIPISFNVSGNSFKNPDYIEYLNSLNVSMALIMEITERVLVKNPEKTVEILSKIKESTALKIAIDDFGIEYSSLRYLKDFPVDEIKIDISFTREIVESKKTRALVKAIITLAKELGMKTLAEGVETSQQLDILKDLGCDYVQGFLLGKPMPEEEAEKLLNRDLLG